MHISSFSLQVPFFVSVALTNCTCASVSMRKLSTCTEYFHRNADQTSIPNFKVIKVKTYFRLRFMYVSYSMSTSETEFHNKIN